MRADLDLRSQRFSSIRAGHAVSCALDCSIPTRHSVRVDQAERLSPGYTMPGLIMPGRARPGTLVNGETLMLPPPVLYSDAGDGPGSNSR